MNRVLSVVVASLVLGGCTLPGGSGIANSSHFAFPNSNVVPLGEAKASRTKLCGIFVVNWGAPNADDQEIAIEEALETSGGDLLINVRTDSSVFIIPYLFSVCSTEVRGTAARMEIGRQDLSAAPPAPQVPPPVTDPCQSQQPPPHCYEQPAAPPPLPPPPTPAPPPPPPHPRAQPAAPIPVPASAQPPRRPGCASDNDCKGSRVCIEGACRAP